MWSQRVFALIRITGAVGALASGITNQAAAADKFAYSLTNDFPNQSDFGVINLTTGAATFCGHTGVALSGLALGPKGVIFSMQNDGSEVYSVNPTNGSLTDIGTSNVVGFGIVSTIKGKVFVLDNTNLYSLNTSTAHATLIGPTNLPGPIQFNYTSVSTGSATLWLTFSSDGVSNSLYSINLSTGNATLIGNGSGGFEASILFGKTLYATSAASPFGVYSISTATGASKLVKKIQGETYTFDGLLKPPAGFNGSCG